MKMLYITSLSGKRINGFMRSAVIAARNLGIEFVMACNMTYADKELYDIDCKTYGIKAVHIDFDKNPLGKSNINAKIQLLALMKREKFDFVQCNTPIGGVLGRICAEKAKIPYVIYMAHGFHFWKGAPKSNWLFYYPVERILAHRTDLLITINEEDKCLAKKFKLKENGTVIYIPGVGVKLKNIQSMYVDKARKREDLGIPQDSFVYVTVGELRKRKNQRALIKAFSKLRNPNSCLLICGMGEDKELLENLIKELHEEDRIKLLGFRSDIIEILKISDCFVFPSYQEGLPVALMEAMAAGLPCIASKIRGNVDLLPNSKLLHMPEDIDAIAKLLEAVTDPKIREYETQLNLEKIKEFEFDKIVKEFEKIYSNIPHLVGGENKYA